MKLTRRALLKSIVALPLAKPVTSAIIVAPLAGNPILIAKSELNGPWMCSGFSSGDDYAHGIVRRKDVKFTIDWGKG